MTLSHFSDDLSCRVASHSNSISLSHLFSFVFFFPSFYLFLHFLSPSLSTLSLYVLSLSFSISVTISMVSLLLSLSFSLYIYLNFFCSFFLCLHLKATVITVSLNAWHSLSFPLSILPLPLYLSLSPF